MDWMGVIASEPIEGEEMPSLATRFATLMRKRAAGPKGETTPSFDGKRMKWSSLDEEARKDWAVISVDSPDRASNDQPVLEGTPNEAGAPLEKGISIRGPSNVEEIGEEVPLGVVVAPRLLPRPANIKPSRKRLPDRVLMCTYVSPQERVYPPKGMVALDPQGAQEIIHR